MSNFFYKPIIIFLIIVLFSSCAIHSSFPFICFRKECIIATFSLSSPRKEAGGNRGIKQSVKILFAKSKAKKIKRRSKKQRSNLKIEVDTIFEKEKILYSPGSSTGICREIQMIIFKKELINDTIVVYFRNNLKKISEEQKQKLKEYIDTVGSNYITKILLKNCHDKNILIEHEIIWLEERALKLAKFLKTLNMPNAIIKIEE